MKKDLKIIIIIVCVLAVIGGSLGLYFGLKKDGKVIGNVTITIRCDKVLDNIEDLNPAKNNENCVPKNGVILQEYTVQIKENNTVYDALKQATREKKMHMEESSSLTGIYIKGINNLYEFDCGAGSGWMYSVNGVWGDVSSSKTFVKDGDVIVWAYTCDTGADLRN